ncbi:MAG: hypothetical protein AAF567_11400 [Actinomycetota bacterium]
MANRRLICTLGPSELDDQLGDWQRLRAQADEITEIQGGYRLRFPTALDAEVRDLAAREASCCSFLTLTVATGSDEVVLEVTSAEADGVAVAALLSGAAS